jgi:hypothetical protein
MNRLLLLLLTVTSLIAAGCSGEVKGSNRDKDKPEPPPAVKK